MYIFTTGAVGVLVAALAGSALAGDGSTTPVTGPFYLTVVPSDGSASYPTNIGVVSRGVEILSSALKYSQQFTYEGATHRIYKAGDNNTYNNPPDVELPFIFQTEAADGGLEQVEKDGTVYLVKTGTGSEGVNAWQSSPAKKDGLPVEINWQGVGTANSNAAIRVDAEEPAARH